MKRIKAILTIIFGIIVFLFFSVILFPYLVVGGVLKFIPVFSSRRWLVSVVSLTLPIIMRYSSGIWSLRFFHGSEDGIIYELLNSIPNLAMSHILVWAGFFSVDSFLSALKNVAKTNKIAEQDAAPNR